MFFSERDLNFYSNSDRVKIKGLLGANQYRSILYDVIITYFNKVNLRKCCEKRESLVTTICDGLSLQYDTVVLH